MKVKELFEVRTNFPTADFWLIRKGSAKTVGTPTREFSPEHIGVKVQNQSEVLPEYAYYLFTFFHSCTAYFQVVARGTLKLKHITVEDVEEIPLSYLK